MHRKILQRTLLLSITTLGLFSCLGQDENIQSSVKTTERQEPKIIQTTQNTQTQQGLTAYVNPETGALYVPTTKERQTLHFQERQLQATTRGSTALEEKKLPDGTVMIDLKGQYQHQINVDIIPNCEQHNKNKACSQKTDNY